MLVWLFCSISDEKVILMGEREKEKGNKRDMRGKKREIEGYISRDGEERTYVCACGNNRVIDWYRWIDR